MLKAFILLFLVAVTSFVAADEAYFKFRYGSYPKEFVFKLTDSAKIQEARRILSGAETDTVHVMGKIIKRFAPYNPEWNYTLDPNTISFFLMAIEVCDASPIYVNDHIEEACGPFLPGCFWCPWASILTEEVNPNQIAPP